MTFFVILLFISDKMLTFATEKIEITNKHN